VKPRRSACGDLLGAALVLIAQPALASMDEAWLSRAPVPPGTRPLLVLVDHASGRDAIRLGVAEPYDPRVDYGARVTAGAACDPARVYWRPGPGPAPDCGTGASLPLDAAAGTGFHCEAGREPLLARGLFVASRAAQWQRAPGGGGWRELRAGAESTVECRADRARHGERAGEWYAASGSAGPFSADPRAEIDWDAAPLSDAYVFFTGNYLNYLAVAGRDGTATLPAAFAAAAELAAAVTEGLDLAIARPADGTPAIDWALPPTPLPAATLVAAALAAPAPLGADAPEATIAAVAEWLATDARAFTHACRATTTALAAADAGSGCADGSCLAAALAAAAAPDLAAALPDLQRARAWIVAPGPAPAGLSAAARTTGTDVLDLGDPLAMVMLFVHAVQRDAGRAAAGRVSAPALPVTDAGMHAAVIYLGRSWPETQRRWPGTLEQRPLGATAASPGFDAAALLAGSASRNLRGDRLTPELMARGGELGASLGGEPRASLGLSQHDPVTIADLVAWLQGTDAIDADADGDRLEARPPLGDPGLDPPVLVRYAGAAPRTLAFVATADGLLHAFDAGGGEEAWAWLPAAQHGSLRALADPAETRVRLARGSGLRLQQADLDGDGAIDVAAGERARLFLGLGAGARGYAALDVSDPDRPRVDWFLGEADLPGIGETIAPPVPARMRVDAVRQRGDFRVVVVTGGYDPLQRARGAAEDAVGGRLAIVTSASGTVLWQAAASAAPGVSLAHPQLTASFAAPPRVVDADGDGLAERIYAIDVAGRLWRFDFGGAAPTARVLARLGTSAAPADAAEARRFHFAPDVVYLRDGAGPRLALAFGSGWAERPRDAALADRFYVVFDTLASDGADGAGALAEPDLADVSMGAPPPASARGWFYRLDAHGPGEKTWGASITLGHRLRFTTWQPLPPDPAAPCGPPRGIARLYSLAIATGLPLEFVDDAPEPAIELPGESPPPPLRLALPLYEDEACASPPCRGDPLLLIGETLLPAGLRNDPLRTSWRRLEIGE
jgi:hypothetical protein